MRKIRKYNAEKYKNEDYTEVEKNIYTRSRVNLFTEHPFHLSKNHRMERGDIPDIFHSILWKIS